MKQLSVAFLQKLRIPDDSQLKAMVQNVVNGLLGIGLGEVDLNQEQIQINFSWELVSEKLI